MTDQLVNVQIEENAAGMFLMHVNDQLLVCPTEADLAKVSVELSDFLDARAVDRITADPASGGCAQFVDIVGIPFAELNADGRL